ncbi:MAG: hypothetical protein B7X04_03065 [Parcubacteria group bacterium 21-54-25]|nr:MAG: hypothetical protein B7X04_03065 [Parcubacteria group bacterium 21-54-25]HQU07933.1 DUF5667 domain-containing protein [Candidatus Paceibacterota bacterium]
MTKLDYNLFTLFKHAKHMRLSSAERMRMRSTLLTYATARPVRTSRLSRLLWTGGRIPSPYSFELSRPMTIFAGLLIAVLLGGGTSYAAQGALPGNILYPIKIHVDEPIQEAFAFSPQSKAAVQASIATTRLDEAQQLAAQGTLSTSTAAVLAANFTSHADQAAQATASIENTDPAAAAEVNASLTARITANKNILEDLARTTATDARAVDGIIVALTAQLKTHGDAGVQASTQATASVSKQVLIDLQMRAQNQLALATSSAISAFPLASSAASSSPVVNFSTQAEAAATLAQNRYDAAITALSTGDSALAYADFADSLNASTQAQAYADAAIRFGKEAVVSHQDGQGSFSDHTVASSTVFATSTSQRAATTTNVQDAQSVRISTHEKSHTASESEGVHASANIKTTIQGASSLGRVQLQGSGDAHIGL